MKLTSFLEIEDVGLTYIKNHCGTYNVITTNLIILISKLIIF